jgi:hypothetical protein
MQSIGVRGLLCLLSVTICSCAGQPNSPALSPAAAPASRVSDLDGRMVAPLAAAASRRATVLLFITHDCPISNGYAPEIRRLCDAYGRQGVAFFLVYSDPAVTPAEARQHYHDYAYTCAAVLDPNHELAALAGATITPEAAVFLPDRRRIYRGRIDDLYVDLGKPRFHATSNDLSDVLDAITKSQPISPRTTTAIGCHIPM